MKLLSLLILFCSCGAANTSDSGIASDTIKVKVNESFTIKLATSMGTGYSWSTADSAYASNMSLDSVTVISNTTGKEDGTDLQVFHFRSLVKSTSQLHFIHKRPWEKAEKADKEKRFTVIIE